MHHQRAPEKASRCEVIWAGDLKFMAIFMGTRIINRQYSMQMSIESIVLHGLVSEFLPGSIFYTWLHLSRLILRVENVSELRPATGYRCIRLQKTNWDL